LASGDENRPDGAGLFHIGPQLVERQNLPAPVLDLKPAPGWVDERRVGVRKA
jgi:hypothetical protein